MIDISKSFNNKYLLVDVIAGTKYHSIMTNNFIESLRDSVGENNVETIKFDVICFYENMFRNPKRFLISLCKLIFRIFKNLFYSNKKKKRYFLYFNPFILHLKDLREIFKLYTNKNINNNYSYLNIRLGDLINDCLQRFGWGDYYLLRGFSRLFLITFTFIILRQCFYFANKLSSQNILYLAAYTTYPNNGIPFRVMSSMNNCDCYSTASVNHTWLRFSRYTLFPFLDYFAMGNKLQNGNLYNLKEAQKIAETGFSRRISGKEDSSLPYMRRSSFSKTKSINGFDLENSSVIYLHDLVDASHTYPKFIFSNMVEYVYFTVRILIKNKKKFFIKLHPNESISSKIMRKEIFDNLNLSKDFIIPASTSNKDILSSNINKIISAHGNIIIEAGYYGHFSIGATQGCPACSFKNLLKLPKDKNDYANLLLEKFEKKDKQKIIYESKLAYFLMFHSDYFLNDIDLVNTRRLYSEYVKKEIITKLPKYKFNFLECHS